jgi:flagellar protein FliS
LGVILAADTQAVMQSAHQVYRQTQAQTAAPGELVVMLYQGALRFVTSAIEALEARDIEGAHNGLVRAQAIIGELNGTLDMERGGQFGRNLSSLYDFMTRRLIDANVRKEVAPAREVQGLLRELLPAWQAAVRQQATPARPLAGAAR